MLGSSNAKTVYVLDGLRTFKAFNHYLNTLILRHDWVFCANRFGAVKCRKRNVIKMNHLIIIVDCYGFVEYEKDAHLD